MFSNKKIKVEITLLSDDFLSGTTLTFEDLPVSAEIEKVSFPSAPKANIRIYGVSKEKMKEITNVAWKSGFIGNKRVRLFVDDGDGYQLLFEGGIWNAMPVYKSAPNVYIQIESSMVAFPNMMKVPPFVSKGESTIFNVINGICNQYGIRCINKGVFGTCGSQYFDENGFSNRIKSAEKTFGVECVFENGKVFVFPAGGRSTTNYVLTKEQYVGYPSFGFAMITVDCDTLFDINIGDTFEIKDSDVDLANDTWVCNKISFSLQTLSNNGKWRMSLTGTRISRGTGWI